MMIALFVTIPADLPEPYASLAGAHLLSAIKPGHFRAVLPAGSPVEWLDLENVSTACVLWFGSRQSANCRPGHWGAQPGIDRADLLPGNVVILPPFASGREAATVELYVPWMHGTRACAPAG